MGMDNRTSSPELAAAAIKGLCFTGIDVTDIGTVATSIFYNSTVAFGIDAGIIVREK